jgi:hypothetical protein
MKTIIQKVDLDTTLTAMIMGVSDKDEIIVSKSDALSEDLNNPDVLCIEAGGGSQIELNNFDHHNTNQKLPPACRQAYEYKMIKDESLKHLVDYVCMVDENSSSHLSVEFPSLSNIFSGMLLVERNPVSQLFKGIGILKKVLDKDIDPFGTMPEIEEWRDYKEAKRINQEKVQEVIKKAGFFKSVGGLKIGYVESDFIGGIGALYSQGCDVVIMYNPAFGEPPVPKYTIAGNNKRVINLLEEFDKIESGWGGRETIIGSPRSGTLLEAKTVIKTIINNL